MPSPAPVPKKNGLRFEGHRGAGALEPENSLKAFQRAIDIGIDGVELDVFVSKDGVPIVVHGTDEGIINFKDSTLDAFAWEVDSKDLKVWRLPNDETIPTLEEVLLLCKDKITVNIEFKEPNPRAVKPVLELLVRLDMIEQVHFSSFVHNHRQTLEEVRQELNIEQALGFGFLVWQLHEFEDYVSKAALGDALNIDYDLLLKYESRILEEMEKATNNGLKIKFYFSFEQEESDEIYKRLKDLNVDTLIINHPLKSLAFSRQ